MRMDPTHVIEQLVVVVHHDSARYLSGTVCFYSILFCTDVKSFSAFFSLPTDMIF